MQRGSATGSGDRAGCFACDSSAQPSGSDERDRVSRRRDARTGRGRQERRRIVCPAPPRWGAGGRGVRPRPRRRCAPRGTYKTPFPRQREWLRRGPRRGAGQARLPGLVRIRRALFPRLLAGRVCTLHTCQRLVGHTQRPDDEVLGSRDLGPMASHRYRRVLAGRRPQHLFFWCVREPCRRGLAHRRPPHQPPARGALRATARGGRRSCRSSRQNQSARGPRTTQRSAFSATATTCSCTSRPTSRASPRRAPLGSVGMLFLSKSSRRHRLGRCWTSLRRIQPEPGGVLSSWLELAT